MLKRREAPQLGAGLIGIGREWGHVKTPVPTEQEAFQYLQSAYRQGVRFFDTAPSYGSSEERLGMFLGTLTRRQRRSITIATKFGEHWDDARKEPYVDHSFNALRGSIDQSIARLGVPDILLLHKTSPQVLQSNDLAQAVDYARQRGIRQFGASVSDLESAQMVLASGIFSYIQLPYNLQKTDFDGIIRDAHVRGKTVVVNRPFNMGALVHEPSQTEEEQQIQAYRFVVHQLRRGDIVLTGTKSPSHLQENVAAFRQAARRGR